jgi:hypothetical protein
MSTDGARRLDDVTLAGIAFEHSVVGGRSCLVARGVDSEGCSLVLARQHGSDWVALFSTLLARGLRADGPILVDAAGCPALRDHILAAWGAWRVVFLPDRAARAPDAQPRPVPLALPVQSRGAARSGRGWMPERAGARSS